MTSDPIRGASQYALPLERLFSMGKMDRVLDYLLSNYELEQKIDDISKSTKLDKHIVQECLLVLLQEKLVVKEDSAYKVRIASERVSGLFSYYRATMNENLKNIEFDKVVQK